MGSLVYSFHSILRSRLIVRTYHISEPANTQINSEGKHFMKFSAKVLPLLALLVCAAGDAEAQSSHSVRSPDKRLELKIRVDDRLRYDLLLNGKTLMRDCTMSLNVDRKTMGLQPKI